MIEILSKEVSRSEDSSGDLHILYENGIKQIWQQNYDRVVYLPSGVMIKVVDHKTTIYHEPDNQNEWVDMSGSSLRISDRGHDDGKFLFVESTPSPSDRTVTVHIAGKGEHYLHDIYHFELDINNEDLTRSVYTFSIIDKERTTDPQTPVYDHIYYSLLTKELYGKGFKDDMEMYRRSLKLYRGELTSADFAETREAVDPKVLSKQLSDLKLSAPLSAANPLTKEQSEKLAEEEQESVKEEKPFEMKDFFKK